MKKRIGVITKDKTIYQKLRLLLRSVADVEEISEGGVPYDLIFEDVDTSENPLAESIRMSRSPECDVRLPFRHEDILKIVESSDSAAIEYITLSGDGRNVYLGQEKIKLTDVEYRLLEALLSADGDFVTRENLLSSIWGDGFDSGVVNVYVHYLRGKLERDGRKIILSSRKEGYGIDRKYRRDR